MNWYKKTNSVSRVIEKAKEVIDGVEYKLFINEKGYAVRVFDIDTGEVVHLINYPDEFTANQVYVKTIEKAIQMAH